MKTMNIIFMHVIAQGAMPCSEAKEHIEVEKKHQFL